MSVLIGLTVIGSIGGAGRSFRLEVLQDLLDAIVLRDRLVVEEGELGDAAQASAEESGGAKPPGQK